MNITVRVVAKNVLYCSTYDERPFELEPCCMLLALKLKSLSSLILDLNEDNEYSDQLFRLYTTHLFTKEVDRYFP